MQPLQPYDDIPGIDEESFTFDHFQTDTPHMAMGFPWATLDPNLNRIQYSQDYSSFQPTKNLQIMRDHLVELENFANGYVHPTPLQIPYQDFARLDIHNPWNDQYRHVRYVSPSGPFGGSLSSTDSSPSERAFSPDVARQYARPSFIPQTGGNVFPSPVVDLSNTGNRGRWPQPHMFVGGLASPSPSQCSAACNPQDLQYTPTPDSSMEDDHFEDIDTIRVKINAPEEVVVLSQDVVSPADSGLGQSLDDDFSINDDDDYAAESDNDTEYTPARAGRKQSMNARRPQMRGPPRRQRSLQTSAPSAVLDPRARVSKPGRPNTTGRPSKKGSAKGDKEAGKQFTCTFSHYGCDSKFASKNEWKRHVASQHLQLGFYRCDVGSCNPGRQNGGSQSKGFNDFNRKDLFTQHHRRMHTPWGNPKEGTAKQWEEFEEQLEGARERCWQVRREPPQRSGCGFCKRVFEDGSGDERNGEEKAKTKEKASHAHANSWEERMEHVGKHFERLDWELEAEQEDEDLTAWALEEDIVRDYGDRGVWLVGMEPADVKQDGQAEKRRSGRRVMREEAGDDEDEEQDAQGEAE